MTTLVTRARLLSTVLRAGDGRRIRRIIDRFEASELSHVLRALDHLDLRRLATALSHESCPVESIMRLDVSSLARITLAARRGDQGRLLQLLSREDSATCAAVLMAMPIAERLDAMEHLASRASTGNLREMPRRGHAKESEQSLVAALRLQRLFA